MNSLLFYMKHIIQFNPFERSFNFCCLPKPTGEHRRATRRAGRLPGLLVGPGPSGDGPQNPAHVLAIARACHLTYTWSGRWWIASISFLHGRHVNIKSEPRSALRLPCESAQKSRLTHGSQRIYDNMGVLLYQYQVKSIYDSLGLSPHNWNVLRVVEPGRYER